MAELDQFNTGATNDLADFQTDDQLAAPVTNASSNQNIAAHVSMLSSNPGDTAGTYNTIRDEYDTLGYSPTADEVTKAAKEDNTQAYRRSSADFLTNPAVADEFKANALARINDPNSDLYRLRAMVGTQEAAKPAPNETEEAASMRGVWAAGINTVLEYQREKQKIYNQIQIQQDANKTATYVGMAEDLIPTVSGYKTASLAQDVAGGGVLSRIWGTILPGEATQDAVDKFNSIPFEQRAAALQKVVDLAAERGSTILLPEEKDHADFALVRDMVETGEFGATERTVHNILGVLDVTGVLAALRMVAGSAKSATKILRAEEGMGGATSATEGSPRRPSPQSDWRTGQQRTSGVYNQEGAPSYAVSEMPGSEVQYHNSMRQYTLSDVQPTSPSQVIKDANPEMARNLHQAVEKDATGDIANGAFGTSREDAIAHNISPQVSTVDGSVASKTSHPERNSDFAFMPDADVINWYSNSSGFSHLTLAEKAALDANVTNDFMNTFGMVARKEMSSISADGGPLNIKAVYGPADSGWASLGDAVDKAKYALRNYGINEDNIDILVRNGDVYKPISSELKMKMLQEGGAGLKGDFLLQVNHKYNYDFLDLEAPQFSSLDVKWNFADRLSKAPGSSGEGSFTTNLFTMDSIYHPDLVKGAVVAGTRGARLEKLMHEAADSFIKGTQTLDWGRVRALDDKIKELNFKGQPLNYASLRAEGFNQKEIEMLESWKSVQDTNWWMNNQAVVRNYQKRGYGLLEIPEVGFKKAARDLPSRSVPENTAVYDAVTDTVRNLSRQEIDAIYAEGKAISKMAHSMESNGVKALHVINPNAAGKGYIRQFRQDDVMLNYRHGYYAVRYKDPHFIERKIVDGSGNESWEAIATAPDAVSANKYMADMTTKQGGEYRVRGDYRGGDRDRAEGQVMMSGGLSAERLRGKRLENAFGSNTGMEHMHIQSPSESLMSSIRAISDRVSFQDWSDTAKARFMAHYSEVLPTVKGQQKFPRTVDEIEGTSKLAADARTTWEYIRAMDNGYTNRVDDLYKGMANGVATVMGEKGFGAMERAVRTASDWSPSSTAKSLVYNLYLVMSPLRQLVVQSAQSISLFAIKPTEGLKMVDDLILYSLYNARNGNISDKVLKMYGRDRKFLEMIEDFRNSGMVDAISHNEFIDSMKTLTAGGRSTRAAAAWDIIKSPGRRVMNTARKYGFDLGEHVNQFMAFKTFYYDKLGAKAGRATNAEIESVIHEARNFTGNFDRRAGVMPYTRASAAMVTQFLNVPHKFISLVTTNRLLSAKQKTAVAASFALMYGVGTEDIYRLFSDELPDNPVVREVITQGLVSAFINNSLGLLFSGGKSPEISMKGSINPIDPQGVMDMAKSLFEEGVGGMIASSPAGSLFFGTNPRVTGFVQTLGSFMGLGGEADKALPVRYGNLVTDAGNLFSGTSHAFKAMQILKYGQKLNSYGGVIADNMTTTQAVAQAFGFSTQGETNYYELMKKASDLNKNMESDVKEVYKQFARRASQQDLTRDQLMYQAQVFNAAMSIYGNNPRAQQIFIGELKKSIADGDLRTFNVIMQMSEWSTNSQVLELLDKAPIPPEQKDNLRSIVNMNLEARAALEEQDKKGK